MPISNTELAQKIDSVVTGHQSFVDQTINWLTAEVATVTLTDPYDPLITAVVKTPWKMQQEFDAMVDPVNGAFVQITGLLEDAQEALEDAQAAQATFEGYNTTFTGYLAEADADRVAAQAARDSAETFATNADTSADSAAASAAAAAASATASAASATASAASASAAAASAVDAEDAATLAQNTRARTWYVDDGVPAIPFVVDPPVLDGDLYLDNTNGNVYEYNSTGPTWGSPILNVVSTTPGPQGNSLVPRGAWSVSSVSYAVLDLAEHNGSTYICYSAHVSAATTEPGVGATWATKWHLCALAGSAVPDDAITTAKIANGAVTAEKLALGTHTVAGSVVAWHAGNSALSYWSLIGYNGITVDNDGDGNIEFSFTLQDNAVTSTKIADNAVVEAKIQNSAVTTGKIAANAVNAGKLSCGSGANIMQTLIGHWPSPMGGPGLQHVELVTDTSLDFYLEENFLYANVAALGITNSHIANGTITGAKLVNGTIGNAQLADETISLGKLEILNGPCFVGQLNGTSEAPTEMTPTQATDLLNTFTTTLKGLVPAPTTATGRFLKDNGTWANTAFTTTVNGLVPSPGSATGKYLKDDGTWASPVSAPTVSRQGSNFNASNNNVYFITANSVTATLSTPANGDTVTFIAETNSITGFVIARNGKNIGGYAEDLTVDYAPFSVTLIFNSTTNDWRFK
jgi:hypothetical protein